MKNASGAPRVKDSGRFFHPKPHRTWGKVNGKVHGRGPSLQRKKPEMSPLSMAMVTGSKTLPFSPDPHHFNGPSEKIEKVA